MKAHYSILTTTNMNYEAYRLTHPIMTQQIFIKACELLKASGSSYEAIITPFWSEEQRGVVVPTIGKVIPLFQPTEDRKTWPEAMKLAEELGQQLPTVEEWHEIRRHRNVINEILASKGGDTIAGTGFWSCTEYSQDIAWLVGFGSGGTVGNGKCNDFYVRPLAAFKKL